MQYDKKFAWGRYKKTRRLGNRVTMVANWDDDLDMHNRLKVSRLSLGSAITSSSYYASYSRDKD
jgi:hypothetical protein